MELNDVFDFESCLKSIKHYLPHQAPLKDFVHHNTLSAFQNESFFGALHKGSEIFGYKTSLNIEEYRQLYRDHKIREDILEQVIIHRKGSANADKWMNNLFNKEYNLIVSGRLGKVRAWWKDVYALDIDFEINGLLFKFLGAYLDQGIAPWHFPIDDKGFLASVRNLEKVSVSDFIRSKKAMDLLLKEDLEVVELLEILVGDETLFEHYLFDQQFSHPGWSGMVTMVEKQPQSLLDSRKICLEDMIKLELILEIDVLETKRKNWQPLNKVFEVESKNLFAHVSHTLEMEAIAIWQEAYEWSYYDNVLAGIQKQKGKSHKKENKTFQALFCIDDREGSIRRYVEKFDPNCETYGTPGHFGIPMYFQPKEGKFMTKVCPAPVTPKHVVKEMSFSSLPSEDFHFSKWSIHPILSIPFSMVMGFWSAYEMLKNIFTPQNSELATASFSHMGQDSELNIEYDAEDSSDELQSGFKTEEMAQIVGSVLKSIGLINEFGEIVYCIGHGASSINNTHYAGYDCGACCGRPGSVNARVFAYMANNKEVRKKLKIEGVEIPDSTFFVGGLHDTTRDEIQFYDEKKLQERHISIHEKNLKVFERSLNMNAKERSRRFFSVDTKKDAEKVHQEVRNRSVSIFEPRPELNHATNSLCIVGRHSLNEGLFLDRRAFANSYDYQIDPKGDLLLNILNACAPVCGGINLEYYFSRTDNQKLGAGSKLPHNVMGLIAVSNGVEGDLRPGLPLQMIEMHDPIRLMMIVEHYPEVVLGTIKRNPATYQWFENEWLILTAIHPETHEIYRYDKGEMVIYRPLKRLLDSIEDIDKLIESSDQNLGVYLIKEK